MIVLVFVIAVDMIVRGVGLAKRRRELLRFVVLMEDGAVGRAVMAHRTELSHSRHARNDGSVPRFPASVPSPFRLDLGRPFEPSNGASHG